jgi:uncharacterized protein DUF6152
MRGAALTTWLILLGLTASAHHSHPDFLENERVVVEGTIEFLEYLNPHSRMEIRTADGISYAIELPAARQLRLPGTNCAEPIYSETLRVGDRIVVTGIPPMDPLRHELLMRNLFRPSDGWERFHEGLHCRN